MFTNIRQGNAWGVMGSAQERPTSESRERSKIHTRKKKIGLDSIGYLAYIHVGKFMYVSRIWLCTTQLIPVRCIVATIVLYASFGDMYGRLNVFTGKHQYNFCFKVYLENLRCVTSWGMVATSIRQNDCTSIPSIFFLRTVLVYLKIFHHARRTSAVDTPIELTDNFVDSLTMLDTHTSHDCGVVWGRDFWHSSSLFDKYMLHISQTHTHTLLNKLCTVASKNPRIKIISQGLIVVCHHHLRMR